MDNNYIIPTILAQLVLTILLLTAPLGGIATAQSLWSDTEANASMFLDHRSHVAGDIITIVISENSTASRTGSSNNTKTSSTSMNAGTGIFHGIAAASAGNSDSFKSQGAITNSNTVSGKITVVVTAVKPNGNLLVAGTQAIEQNGETQKITVTGEVRPADITSDNTVMSYNVANAEIRVDGKGPLASKQREGILTQIFNFLF